MPHVSASAEEEITALRVFRSPKIRPFGVGLPFRIIKHRVCKIIVDCNATLICVENKVSSICVRQ